MSEQEKATPAPEAKAPAPEAKAPAPEAKLDAKRQAALQGALSQIEKQFGKGTVMRMGDRRGPAGAGGGDLRSGILRKDDARLPHNRRGSEAGRGMRVRRRRARDGPAVRAADRGGHRRAAGFTARLR